ncbi:MAG TPA: inner membrane CreD family protein [Candidatus Acidoferrales bacterium]
MVKRIVAIAFVFVMTAVAWAILGSTIFYRTYETDSALRGRVVSIWGAPHKQGPSTASYEQTVPKTVETIEEDRKIVRKTQERIVTPLPLESSRVDVALDLEHRRKGLLWYSTYKVAFAGAYTFRNASNQDQLVTFTLNFPTAQAIYDDLTLSLDDSPMPITNEKTAVRVTSRVAAGKAVVLKAAYRSQGLQSWRYDFGGEVAEVRDFVLKMKTNFKAIDFPENTLSASEKRETPDGWELTWTYKNLVTGFQIGMTLPEKLQPGPLAGRISYFAPISLFFFFFLMFIITTLRGIELHPMNYFFLAAAFFAFHLLLAYLVDHLSIHAAFAICSAVSIFLVVSYLRLVAGMRFALVEAGLGQLIYLVLFSYTFFLKGYTGLAVTIGSIITLFVVMQMTGRISWAEKFARKPA